MLKACLSQEVTYISYHSCHLLGFSSIILWKSCICYPSWIIYKILKVLCECCSSQVGKQTFIIIWMCQMCFTCILVATAAWHLSIFWPVCMPCSTLILILIWSFEPSGRETSNFTIIKWHVPVPVCCTKEIKASCDLDLHFIEKLYTKSSLFGCCCQGINVSQAHLVLYFL